MGSTQDRSEIERALGGCELFRGLAPEAIGRIAHFCRIIDFDAGERLFAQGDFGEQLFVIAEGHVFLERSVDLSHREGKVLIGMFGRGRVLGCWSALLGEPHHLMSSATCQKPTRVVVIPGEGLRAVMLQDKELGLCVLERLCRILRGRLEGAYGAMEKV